MVMKGLITMLRNLEFILRVGETNYKRGSAIVVALYPNKNKKFKTKESR